jgi:hypothetical protein
MSDNPKPILGTFFRAGERLTGIIHTPTFRGRMVFRPDGHEEGRLIASINGWTVGFAELVSAEGENLTFTVSLHPGIVPQRKRLELASEDGGWFLTSP